MTEFNIENNTNMPPCYAYEPLDNIMESFDEESCCFCKNIKVKHDSIVHVSCCICSKSYHYDEICTTQHVGYKLTNESPMMNRTHA